jgi:hypothetical protein
MAIILIANLSRTDKKSEGETVVNPANYVDETVQVQTMENFVEPGKNTLDIDDITGFAQKKNNEEGNSNASKKKTDKNENNSEETSASSTVEEIKMELSDPNLTVESVGSYTGNYIEDGTDDPISNVTAMVITNHSDKMLQVGDITFQVNKKETANFRVTNLLPGTSVLVLELNKREYHEKDDFSYGEVSNAYLESPDVLSDKFTIEKKDGELVIKNKTDKSYKKVYVYYKYAQSGGAFMGGITYRVPFENVDAKATVTSVANHFSKNTSIIVDVQIVEE